ncbi:DUF6415 family natural product biosynthesis protein [Streptomyces sp. NPDC020799]|uniref:DUF6415 family natural product biosynthesis protein n=1 Tax=Streptomyces sp. NPDC020799 TaxID=3365091 RepID=UPI0037A39BFE
MTTTPPCDTLNVGAIAKDIDRGLEPRDGQAALQVLERQLRAHIEALIPLVEAEAEHLRETGRFGDAVRDSAAKRGRRLLSSRTIDTDPDPTQERVVSALAHVAKSLLLYSGLR